jgi:formamidopyrimidine-DNA glycosylase
MPELPEVEELVRHLAPIIKGKTIRSVEVHRARVIRPTAEGALKGALAGATFVKLARRGKYLLFTLRSRRGAKPVMMVGHLGMTGRIYLLPKNAPLPKHAAVVLDLGKHRMIFEDTRYFGRLTLDTSSPEKLGPEPLGGDFSAAYLFGALQRSSQGIKVKLLDQALVAGVGNIYASEALYRAGISPRTTANKLTKLQIGKLRRSIRRVLERAIRQGSTVPLDFAGTGARDGLFYYGQEGEGEIFHPERLLVYDRNGQACRKCGTKIERIIQAARSTFYCPSCQAD